MILIEGPKVINISYISVAPHMKSYMNTVWLFEKTNQHNVLLSVDFSCCWINLVEAWYSLEQYIGLKEDKLSSTTVDFIRSEGNLETKHLYWFSKPKMC